MERVGDPMRVGDGALMARVREGDREAFALLVDRHKDALVGYLAGLTGSPERAEDLAQESFLRLYQAASRYRDEGHFAAYLYRIALNLLRSEERRARRWRLLRPLLLSTNGHPRQEPKAARRLLERELQRRLVEAVARLPLKLRVPLLLYEMEGWRQRDIARFLGCREGTVKSRLHRARRRLREELAPYRNGGGR